MASEDQSNGKGPSESPPTPFKWGEVLSSIKDQIPSLDSDISLSDCEEEGELSIFQRDQPNLIPDLSEELEDIPLKEADLQKTFAFMSHPRNIWNEDLKSSAFQKEKSGQCVTGQNVIFLDEAGFPTEKTVSPQNAAPSEFTTNECKLGEGVLGDLYEKEFYVRKNKATPSPLHDELPVEEASPSLMVKASEEERRKLIETEILSKVTLGPLSGDVGHPQSKNNNNNLERKDKAESGPVSEYPRELTLFAFKDIEKWDLDKVLQDIKKQSEDRRWTTEIAFPSTDYGEIRKHNLSSCGSWESYRATSQARLMEKLEELCYKQSRSFFARDRRRRAKFPHVSEVHGEERDVPILAPLTNGQRLTPRELQCTPEPPTIYIDLRNTEVSQKPELTDEKQSSSDSSTEDEDSTAVTNKVKETMQEFSQLSRNECTGKSFLLQQLHNFRKKMGLAKDSEIIEQDRGMRQHLKYPEETGLLEVRRRYCPKLGGLMSIGPENSASDTEDFFLEHANNSLRPTRKPKKKIQKETSSETPQVCSVDENAKCSRY